MSFKESKKILISGVHKSATSSLHLNLSRHSLIKSGSKKEIGHYAPIRYNKKINSYDIYKNFFTYSDSYNGYFIDSSPSYFYGGKKAALLIKQENPNSKIILSLRDPSFRLLSIYNASKNDYRLNQDLSCKDFINKAYNLRHDLYSENIVSRSFYEGCYANYLQDWIDVFGNDLKIILFDEITTKPSNVLIEIFDWLGLEEDKNITQEFITTNKTLIHKNKYLYRFANFINNRNESFFKNNLAIKDFLKRIYMKLNAAELNKSYEENDLITLKKLYAPFNDQLDEIFKRNNLKKDISSW